MVTAPSWFEKVAPAGPTNAPSLTRTSRVASTPSTDAPILVDPTATPVTRPPETVAVDGSDEDHEVVRPESVAPLASLEIATSIRVPAGTRSNPGAASMMTDATDGDGAVGSSHAIPEMSTAVRSMADRRRTVTGPVKPGMLEFRRLEVGSSESTGIGRLFRRSGDDYTPMFTERHPFYQSGLFPAKLGKTGLRTRKLDSALAT